MTQADSVFSTPRTDSPPETSFAALAAAVHPDWHEAIQRLDSSITCVSCLIDNLIENHEKRSFVARCASLIEALILVLDTIDPDPDLEPSLGWPVLGRPIASFPGRPGDDRERDDCDDEGGADDEPSLGSHEIKEGGVVVYLHRPIIAGGGVYLDGEEQCDDEGVQL